MDELVIECSFDFRNQGVIGLANIRFHTQKKCWPKWAKFNGFNVNYEWSSSEYISHMFQPPAREYDYNGIVENDMGEMFDKMYSYSNHIHKSLEHCAR